MARWASLSDERKDNRWDVRSRFVILTKYIYFLLTLPMLTFSIHTRNLVFFFLILFIIYICDIFLTVFFFF